MPFFIVTMSHPDGEGWGTYLQAHVDYLKRLIDEGYIKASGRLKGKSLRSGFIIFKADNLEQVEALIAEDPFSQQDLIAELAINEWEPFFGMFASEVSAPPELNQDPD